jgi:hypothetical protein
MNICIEGGGTVDLISREREHILYEKREHILYGEKTRIYTLKQEEQLSLTLSINVLCFAAIKNYTPYMPYTLYTPYTVKGV